MSVGAFYDKILFLAVGAYLIYISKKQKEKLGEKRAKWLKICGVVLIVIQIILIFL